MMTSDTRAGSTPARSRAALMATAPRSWAGVVANAPLKLPTGVRAALTMTTSSDMDILLKLKCGARRRLDGGPVSRTHPVNLGMKCQSASLRRTQNARQLTVLHKTVAEPH